MNYKIFILLLVGVVTVISCKKEDSNQIPKFEGLTLRECEQDFNIIDDSDWRIDDKFSEIERNLFDTLKFESSFLKESSFADIINDGIVGTPKVSFCPNPTSGNGYFRFTSTVIMNLVIVNQKFEKKYEFRGQYPMIAIDLSSFPYGMYRMYYVLQDTNYQIVGIGHGDIKIGDPL